MDRGLILIEGQTVWDYKAQWLSHCHPGFLASENQVSDILDNLFGLEILWLEGKCSFQDSLLTCLWMQSPNAAENAGAHGLALFCMALSVACGLASDLIRDAKCTTFPEDFRPNLGGYAQKHLAESLLNRLNETLSSMPHGRAFFHFARLAAWLDLLQNITSLTNETIERLDFCSVVLIISIIDELVDSYEPHDCSTTSIHPLFANMLGHGCLRRGVHPLPFIEAAKAHNQILTDIVRVKSFDKPKTISELIHRTLKVRLNYFFGPVAMSFHSQYFVPLTHNFFMDEIVRMCSHSASRQRRLIPKLIERYCGINSQNLTHTYWACCLAEHYISLGFTLHLYTDYEFNESVMLLNLLARLRTQFESNLSTNEYLPFVSHRMVANGCSLRHIEPHVDQSLYDARFTARWSFILRFVRVESFKGLCEEFDNLDINYYSNRLKSAKSVFLLP